MLTKKKKCNIIFIHLNFIIANNVKSKKEIYLLRFDLFININLLLTEATEKHCAVNICELQKNIIIYADKA